MSVFLVSHFHWDREWYRTYDEFRARLVDAIDAVVDQCDTDPGFRFLLDGQAIVLEDYLEARPDRRDALIAGIRDGRLGAGPWYVQPDSLLPSGEAHVRNLLEGRAVVRQFGPVSTVAYVPDSFGHPAQFPQLFAGFGLDPFVYWRGNGGELDTLGSLYRWCGPDGSAVRAWQLAEGYFGAAGLDADADIATTVERLQPVIERLRASTKTDAPVLLMNGFDHLPADTSTAAIAAAVGAQRTLLDAAAAALPPISLLSEFTGELCGARTANLLPGVWSARMPLKLRNRAIETLLGAWAEPWSALGRVLGVTDERPALRRAWRTLLCNQAHDSIGGCSIDAVHERMLARYDDAEGLGRATVQRVLERLAGRGVTRPTPWREAQDVVVFNASPASHTDVVRVPLEGFPPWRMSVSRFDFHPMAMPSFSGLAIDGTPVRVVASDDPARVRFLPGVGGLDVEFVARDLPPFGCRRYRLTPSDSVPDDEDDGTELTAGPVRVAVEPGGTLSVSIGARTFAGCFGIEDMVDRGDSYDCDPEARDIAVTVSEIRRQRHESGISRLRIVRELEGIGTLTVEACVAPDVPFVRCDVTFDNRGEDHRLRLRFPTGTPAEHFEAATTFDTARRSTTPPNDSTWVHPAPRTFAHQGWVAANGLVVGAPGLPEAEVTPDGDVLITLVRSVGALARITVRTRPLPAGPEMLAPGAQVPGAVSASITIATTPRDARRAEVGLWGVLGDDPPRLDETVSLLTLDEGACELSTCKPAEDGDGVVVRVLNPSGTTETAVLHFGFDLRDAHAVRLDEAPADHPLEHDGRTVRIPVPPHALRSVCVTPSGGTT